MLRTSLMLIPFIVLVGACVGQTESDEADVAAQPLKACRPGDICEDPDPPVIFHPRTPVTPATPVPSPAGMSSVAQIGTCMSAPQHMVRMRAGSCNRTIGGWTGASTFAPAQYPTVSAAISATYCTFHWTGAGQRPSTFNGKKTLEDALVNVPNPDGVEVVPVCTGQIILVTYGGGPGEPMPECMPCALRDPTAAYVTVPPGDVGKTIRFGTTSMLIPAASFSVTGLVSEPGAPKFIKATIFND
jgi:hypothetical protein